MKRLSRIKKWGMNKWRKNRKDILLGAAFVYILILITSLSYLLSEIKMIIKLILYLLVQQMA
jgi:hypothetical protein